MPFDPWSWLISFALLPLQQRLEAMTENHPIARRWGLSVSLTTMWLLLLWSLRGWIATTATERPEHLVYLLILGGLIVAVVGPFLLPSLPPQPDKLQEKNQPESSTYRILDEYPEFPVGDFYYKAVVKGTSKRSEWNLDISKPQCLHCGTEHPDNPDAIGIFGESPYPIKDVICFGCNRKDLKISKRQEVNDKARNFFVEKFSNEFHV